MESEQQRRDDIRQNKLARMQAFLRGIDEKQTMEERLELGKTLKIEFGVVEEPDLNPPETDITE